QRHVGVLGAVEASNADADPPERIVPVLGERFGLDRRTRRAREHRRVRRHVQGLQPTQDRALSENAENRRTAREDRSHDCSLRRLQKSCHGSISFLDVAGTRPAAEKRKARPTVACGRWKPGSSTHATRRTCALLYTYIIAPL